MRFIGLGLMVILLAAGCSQKHLAQQVTSRTDSVRSMEKTSSERKDSVYFIRDVKPQVLEGSTVARTYTRAQLDSLINALKSMPSVSRTIYATDPRMQTTLAIVLDSLGRISLRCTTAERTYYETSIEQGRVLESNKMELREKEQTIRELETKLMEYRKSWFGRLADDIKLIVLVIAIVVVIAGLWIFKNRPTVLRG